VCKVLAIGRSRPIDSGFHGRSRQDHGKKFAGGTITMHLANAPHVDQCQTAGEVIAHAREVIAKRRQNLAPNLPSPIKIKPPKVYVKKSPKPAEIARQDDPILPALAFPRIIEIQKVCCKYFGIWQIDLLSSRRTGSLVYARHVAMYLAKTLTLHSYPEIGRRFGGRDHTTILHAFRKIERSIPNNTILSGQIETLTNILSQKIIFTKPGV